MNCQVRTGICFTLPPAPSDFSTVFVLLVTDFRPNLGGGMVRHLLPPKVNSGPTLRGGGKNGPRLKGESGRRLERETCRAKRRSRAAAWPGNPAAAWRQEHCGRCRTAPGGCWKAGTGPGRRTPSTSFIHSANLAGYPTRNRRDIGIDAKLVRPPIRPLESRWRLLRPGRGV